MWYWYIIRVRRFGLPLAVPPLIVLENMQSKARLKLDERGQTATSNVVGMANKQKTKPADVRWSRGGYASIAC